MSLTIEENLLGTEVLCKDGEEVGVLSTEQLTVYGERGGVDVRDYPEPQAIGPERSFPGKNERQARRVLLRLTVWHEREKPLVCFFEDVEFGVCFRVKVWQPQQEGETIFPPVEQKNREDLGLARLRHGSLMEAVFAGTQQGVLFLARIELLRAARHGEEVVVGNGKDDWGRDGRWEGEGRSPTPLFRAGSPNSSPEDQQGGPAGRSSLGGTSSESGFSSSRASEAASSADSTSGASRAGAPQPRAGKKKAPSAEDDSDDRPHFVRPTWLKGKEACSKEEWWERLFRREKKKESEKSASGGRTGEVVPEGRAPGQPEKPAGLPGGVGPPPTTRVHTGFETAGGEAIREGDRVFLWKPGSGSEAVAAASAHTGADSSPGESDNALPASEEALIGDTPKRKPGYQGRLKREDVRRLSGRVLSAPVRWERSAGEYYAGPHPLRDALRRFGPHLGVMSPPATEEGGKAAPVMSGSMREGEQLR